MVQSFKSHLNHWGRFWNVPHLGDIVTVVYSPRLRTSLGRANREQRNIRLHPRLQKDLSALALETLCHEAAHIAVWILHGKTARPHGVEWRELVIKAKYVPRTSHEVIPKHTHPRRAPRRYIYLCRGCGYEYRNHVFTKLTFCPRCNQPLEVRA